MPNPSQLMRGGLCDHATVALWSVTKLPCMCLAPFKFSEPIRAIVEAISIAVADYDKACAFRSQRAGKCGAEQAQRLHLVFAAGHCICRQAAGGARRAWDRGDCRSRAHRKGRGVVGADKAAHHLRRYHCVRAKPGSVKFSVCKDEAAFAERQNKRFVPIVARDLGGREVPAALARLNYIFFTPDVPPQTSENFDKAVRDLVRALETRHRVDPRTHTARYIGLALGGYAAAWRLAASGCRAKRG